MYTHFLISLTLVTIVLAIPSSFRPRLSLAEPDWNQYRFHEPQGPGTYAFGYDIDDPGTNNVQFRNEERHPNGTVTGSYGYVEPNGNVRVVNYIADHLGYRQTEENSLKLSMLKPIRVPDSPFEDVKLHKNHFQSENTFRQPHPANYITESEPLRVHLPRPYYH